MAFLNSSSQFSTRVLLWSKQRAYDEREDAEDDEHQFFLDNFGALLGLFDEDVEHGDEGVLVQDVEVGDLREVVEDVLDPEEVALRYVLHELREQRVDQVFGERLLGIAQSRRQESIHLSLAHQHTNTTLLVATSRSVP